MKEGYLYSAADTVIKDLTYCCKHDVIYNKKLKNSYCFECKKEERNNKINNIINNIIE